MQNSNKNKEVSRCCQSTFHVEGGDEGTCHYECDKCGNACDPLIPKSEERNADVGKTINTKICKYCNTENIHNRKSCFVCGADSSEVKPSGIITIKQNSTRIVVDDDLEYELCDYKVDGEHPPYPCENCKKVKPSNGEWEEEFEKTFIIPNGHFHDFYYENHPYRREFWTNYIAEPGIDKIKDFIRKQKEESYKQGQEDEAIAHQKEDIDVRTALLEEIKNGVAYGSFGFSRTEKGHEGEIAINLDDIIKLIKEGK